MPDHLPKQKRRWLRFSMRTMLVAITLLCLWFGFYMKSVRQQSRAVATIRQAEGQVTYSYERQSCVSGQEPPLPRWLYDYLGNDYFYTVIGVQLSNDEPLDALFDLPSIERVSFTEAELTGDNLEQIRSLKNLYQLGFHWAKLKEGHLASLQGMPNLKRLVIQNTPIEGEWLRHVTQLEGLETLTLVDANLAAADLQELTSFGVLRHLFVSGTEITEKALVALEQALPKCEVYR